MQYLYIKISININLGEQWLLGLDLPLLASPYFSATFSWTASTCRSELMSLSRSALLAWWCSSTRSCCRRDTDSTRAAVVMPESLLVPVLGLGPERIYISIAYEYSSSRISIFTVHLFSYIVCPFVSDIVSNKTRFLFFCVKFKERN